MTARGLTGSGAAAVRAAGARAVKARTSAATAVIAVLAAGCGSAGTGSASPASAGATAGGTVAAAAAPLLAATSVTTAGGTWAVLPMGGTGDNLFWQLFGLTSSSGQWSLQTPPDIATNGAVVLAPQAGTLFVGVRPSIDLSFSPVMDTSDGGKNWTALSPASGLANTPGALAAAPDGQLIALGDDQQVSTLASAEGNWSSLTSEQALAATPAGRACDLTALTATAYTPSGTPLLGGACGKGSTAGVFAYSGGTWRITGPRLTGSPADGPVQVLRLTRTGDTDIVLLEEGSGSAAALVAAWTSDGGTHWTESPTLRLDGASPSAASLGADGAIGVMLPGDHADVIQGPGDGWESLPDLPAAGSSILALPSSQLTQVLTATASTLDVWRLAPAADTAPAKWVRTQVITVPIQYGSSD